MSEKILNILLKARYGLSISKIAEELNCSRTTIAKYLKKLEIKKLVFVQDIGQYKLWHHHESFIQNNNRFKALSTFFEPFYNSLMRNLPSIDVSEANIKLLGERIAQELSFVELTNLFMSLNKISLNRQTSMNLNLLVEVIKTIIDNVFQSIDDYHWGVPIVLAPEKIIIMRMEGSKYITIPMHFHLLTGIMEHVMNQYTQVSVTVQQINQKEGVIDIRFQLG